MDIKEIRKKRDELAENISKLIDQFNHETDLYVEDIEFKYDIGEVSCMDIKIDLR